jgi:hypothetical protein
MKADDQGSGSVMLKVLVEVKLQLSERSFCTCAVYKQDNSLFDASLQVAGGFMGVFGQVVGRPGVHFYYSVI